MTTSIKSANRSTPRTSLPRTFLDKLGEMQTEEQELAIALPLVVAAAKSNDLKTLLRVHLKETKGHVKALEQVAVHLNRALPSKRCPTVTKLIVEAIQAIGKRLVSSDQDAALIAVARKIERFEVHSYQELCAAAKDEGLTHELALLTSVLSQERMAYELLGELAAGKGPTKTLVEKASLKRAASMRRSA